MKTTTTVASLRDAYRRGQTDVIRQFIEAGGDINTQDNEGMTLLHHAAAERARPCIRVLVASGKCDYLLQDNKGRYAVELAIEWARDYAVARLLAQHQCRQAFARGTPAWAPPPARTTGP